MSLRCSRLFFNLESLSIVTHVQYADQLVSQLSYDNQQYKLLLGTVLLDEYLFSLSVFPYTLIDACFSI